MTKNQEIEKFREIVLSLPPDSYIRPFLAHLLPQFEADVRSDIITEAKIADLRHDAAALTFQAAALKSEVRALTEKKYDAEEKAKLFEARADAARHQLTEAKRQLQGLVSNLHDTLIR